MNTRSTRSRSPSWGFEGERCRSADTWSKGSWSPDRGFEGERRHSTNTQSGGSQSPGRGFGGGKATFRASYSPKGRNPNSPYEIQCGHRKDDRPSFISGRVEMGQMFQVSNTFGAFVLINSFCFSFWLFLIMYCLIWALTSTPLDIHVVGSSLGPLHWLGFKGRPAGIQVGTRKESQH